MLKINNCNYSKSILVKKYKTNNIETLIKYVNADHDLACRKLERSHLLFNRKAQNGYNVMRAMNLQNGNTLNWSN